ncbi:hypothetical protein BDK51DRAFT_39787 [Blyttiomyces helicus]|uniref:Uncharacterized protein n=1 Tax=Blyttiomyces helicus TaxID=388810 RepID=A0A4V1ISQ1_9FUNG|nr:hypothetical protein BDK51DRAFT_39787 [Blyttiomyces helicus]|eukprot:RKO94337.1 hypothetical protein BDK51DRAFT_39787 [Blyttiomyces helicus]
MRDVEHAQECHDAREGLAIIGGGGELETGRGLLENDEKDDLLKADTEGTVHKNDFAMAAAAPSGLKHRGRGDLELETVTCCRLWDVMVTEVVVAIALNMERNEWLHGDREYQSNTTTTLFASRSHLFWSEQIVNILFSRESGLARREQRGSARMSQVLLPLLVHDDLGSNVHMREAAAEGMGRPPWCLSNRVAAAGSVPERHGNVTARVREPHSLDSPPHSLPDRPQNSKQNNGSSSAATSAPRSPDSHATLSPGPDDPFDENGAASGKRKKRLWDTPEAEKRAKIEGEASEVDGAGEGDLAGLPANPVAERGWGMGVAPCGGDQKLRCALTDTAASFHPPSRSAYRNHRRHWLDASTTAFNP